MGCANPNPNPNPNPDPIPNPNPNQVRRSSSLRAANESIFFVAPLLQGYATFALHVALGREITPEMAVITLALLNVVQLSLTKFFCLGVEFGAHAPLEPDPNPNH